MSFSCPADLNTEATELAKGLGSLNVFLDAARSLLASIRSLSSELFRQQIRKVGVSAHNIYSTYPLTPPIPTDNHFSGGKYSFRPQFRTSRPSLMCRVSKTRKIARATLIRAGVKLHTFTSCSPPLQPLKSEYFAILRALKERHRDIVDRKGRRRFRGSTHLPSLVIPRFQKCSRR